MFKVINISDFVDTNITVDRTDITVDNIDITVDATEEASGTYNFKLPYRFFSENIKVKLYNELTTNVTYLNLEVTDEMGEMVLDFAYNFKLKDSYEVTITSQDNDKLIWRGKWYITDNDNLGEYTMTEVIENGSGKKIIWV